MDENEAKRVGLTIALVFVAVLVLLPMLYVLSIGPVFWLQVTGRIGESRVLKAVYSPLYWTLNNVPVAGHAIATYMGWWATQPDLPTPPVG
jgi:ABC-type sulfate transport system permease component